MPQAAEGHAARALLAEHGARANVLAERSQFSALGLAAFHGL